MAGTSSKNPIVVETNTGYNEIHVRMRRTIKGRISDAARANDTYRGQVHRDNYVAEYQRSIALDHLLAAALKLID